MERRGVISGEDKRKEESEKGTAGVNTANSRHAANQSQINNTTEHSSSNYKTSCHTIITTATTTTLHKQP